MVLGLRSKNRKGSSSVEVDYVVHVQEIKPWPPSKSLNSVESVLLQWENGDQRTGLFTSGGVGDGKIEFNDSFRLPVTLCREGKSKARESFQKNCLEFHLYESRKDKAVKGQLLGSAVVNVADYGVVKEITSIYAPLNCKRSFRSTVQPVLFVKVHPFDKDGSTSSSKASLLEEVSLDKDGSQSAVERMSEENYEETEIASITDDDDDDFDIPSHSSRTSSSSVFETTTSLLSRKENTSESEKNGTWRDNEQPAIHLKAVAEKPQVNTGTEVVEHLNGSLPPLSSKTLSPDHGIPAYNHASLSKSPAENFMPVREKSAIYNVNSSFSSLGYLNKNQSSDTLPRGFEYESMSHEVHKKVTDESSRIQENTFDSFADNGHEEQILEEKLSSDKELVFRTPECATKTQVSLRSDTLPLTRRVVGVQGSKVTSNKLQHVKSVQFLSDSAKIKQLIDKNKIMDKEKVIDTREDDNTSTSYSKSERKETAHSFDDSKVLLESRVEMLEEELREAAAIEIGLYSVVAEHGSSVNKVHAPARRLSRFYLHACKAESQAKQASAARAAVSGLVLVSKACGNDVPRLAFWLSNSIVLRGIVSQAVEKWPISAESCIKSNGGGKKANKKLPCKGNKLSPNEEEQNNSQGSSDDWEDPLTFIVALENIEAWIFSRIVESVWWQTLTPYMQSAAAKGSSRKTNVRRNGLGDQEQGIFSIDLWKKAFKDACERLCPIRAGGHECGCLPVLARLVMEQLVDRLDVAMFNAILRESAEEMPTDPVSDPISDSRVLPIPAGESSFGAGVQLKNAVGNWSRWLTDLFGIDDDSPENENNLNVDKRPENETSFKAFQLLNALSDLMMLPLEMLADSSTRKEVCPTFGTPLIKTVLNNFIPDEFCPEPIPESVFEALDSEDSLQAVGESVSSFPVSATPPVYSPPPAASLTGVIGEVGSQALSRIASSVLKKSYTSDDELDELDSPISSIIGWNSLVSASSTRPDWRPKAKGGRNVVRYKLLREVWTMER